MTLSYALNQAKDIAEEGQRNFRGFSGAQQKDTRPRPAENAKYRHLPMNFVSAGSSGNAAPPTVDTPRPADDSDATTPHDDTTHEELDSEEIDVEDHDDEDIQTNIMMDVHLNVDMDNMQIDATNSRMGSKMLADNDDSRSDARHTAVEMEVDAEQPAFVVDTVGDSTLEAGGFHGTLPVRRAVSPARSDSSEEVVFSGRRQATVVNDPVERTAAPKQARSSQPVRQSSPHPTDDLLAALSQPLAQTSAPSVTTTASSKHDPPPYTATASSHFQNGWASRPSPHDLGVRPQDEWAPAPAVPYWRKQPKKARPDLDPSTDDMQAYTDAPARASKVQFATASTASNENKDADVTSLQADWKSALKEKKKAKKAGIDSEDDNDFAAAKGKKRRGKRGRKQDNRAMRKAIDSNDEDSFGEAAYDDYMENLKAQMDAEDEAGDEDNVLGFKFAFGQKGSATLGSSMVVDGKEIDDDEVLPKSTKKIAAREAALDAANDESDWESDDSSVLRPNQDEVSSDDDFSLDSSELEDDIEYTERQQWEDEDDVRQRRLDRITDEQIARLLAKQEEFGMAGDELLIEDDGAFPYTPEEGVGDIEAARIGLYNITNNSFARPPNKRNPRPKRGDRKHNFPDASALADTVDQYGEHGFDIMDFERPSLRPTKKGRKGKMPPELEMLSDEELKATVDETWRRDRMKKAQKKLEREQLRRDGLLGSAGRKGKADLNARYPLGMTMVEVHNELRDFLQDEDLYERSFPPLAQVQRKALHEIALALNLNSRSQGAGKNRFPIVYKTSRTQEYSPDMFDRVMNASGRGFLTRGKAKKMAKGKGGAIPKASRGGNPVHVTNGHIVGAGAAEIGHESMGHKLMMKMGWSKGQGLGKEGEGMKNPVEQKVRLGTAGLG